MVELRLKNDKYRFCGSMVFMPLSYYVLKFFVVSLYSNPVIKNYIQKPIPLTKK